MCTLPNVRLLVQHLLTGVPPRLRHRVSCGIQAFSLQELVSVNSNGRSLARNRKTGESRAYRVLHDPRTVPHLLDLILTLVPQGKRLWVSLDHSQFGPFCIAVLAVSSRRGRAIPFWCQVNLGESGLMAPLLGALRELASQLSPGAELVLVMDRWFCGKRLFELVLDQGWCFICRSKYGRKVGVPWGDEPTPVGEVSPLETAATYQGMNLRLVRSTLKPGMEEPWFLLTNLPEELTRVQILHRYAERFEIEETFKDAKWLQRLEWLQVKRPAVVRALLLFAFLGWWIFWQLSGRDQQQAGNPKQRLSWFRAAFEQLKQLCWPEALRFTPLSP